MSNDLRAKLNAAAEAEQQKEAESKAATEKYHATALKEYPRLINELLSRVKALLDGVNGLKIDVQQQPEILKYSVGSTATGFRDSIVGTVQVPVWTVRFFDRSISFKPAGIGYFGAQGAIEVQTSRQNPFQKGKIMIVSKKERDGWILGVINGNPHASPHVLELTDEILSEALQKALL